VGSRVLEPVRTALRACVILFVLVRAWVRIRLVRRPREDEIYRAVVRLGPTAVKLAQVASTRPDLVPASVSRRLESLQEAAPRFPFAEAKRVVEEELEAPLAATFRDFPKAPIASASLSQVYFTTLADGTEVAVKVQRPGIDRRIRRDVRILRGVARLVGLLRPRLRNLHLADAIAEFGRWTLRELDFRLEGQNADELRRNFAAWPDIHLPIVHWSLTRKRVLTMERVAGRRVKDLMQDRDDETRLQLVRRLADMVMKMFVDDGLFHADLHPGNIFFPDDGRIVLLDVGMVGRMNRGQTDRFLAYWVALGRRQRDRAFHHLLALARETRRADLPAYRAAYDQILDRFDGSTVTEQSLARTYLDVVQSGAGHGVIFPSEMLLQAKALVTMEALCLYLAPGFRFSEEIRPIVARRLAERASPAALVDRLWTMLPDLLATGELFYTERHPRDRHVEPAFRREARSAIAQAWVDAADVWLSGFRDARWPDARDQPELAALLDLVAQLLSVVAPAHAAESNAGVEDTPEARWASFQRRSRGDAPPTTGSWRDERPWLDASAAALLPLARVALARAEAALTRRHPSP